MSWWWPFGGEEAKPEPAPPPPPRHSSDYLRKFADKILHTDLSKVSLQQRCLAIQHLRNHILAAAERDKLAARDEDGDIQYVYAIPFQKEILALNRLLDSVAYSPKLNEWLEKRRHEFVHFLHEHFPPSYLEEEWKKQNLLQRVKTVSHIMREQCRMYREGAMDFFPSKVVVFNKSATMRGYTSADPAYLKSNEIPDIHIRRDMLEQDTPYAALEVAHHEQIHIFLMQMAMADARQQFPDSNELKADADIKLARVFCLAAMPTTIAPSYWNDPEEIVCHTQDDLFVEEYRDIPFWQTIKNRFLTPDPL